MRISKTGLLAAVLAALLPAAVAAQEEDRPKIFLEKRIFADTSTGKKSFYEVHTVTEGESLWRILGRKGHFSSADYGLLLKEFRRANPEVSDPGKLKPGQRILVPSGPAAAPEPQAVEGKTVLHRIAKGENLTRLLVAGGISRANLPRYLAAVKELNESIRDVNRIMAGKAVLLPTRGYFAPPQEAPTVARAPETPPAPPPAAPAAEVPPALPLAAPAKDAASEAPAVALTKDVPAEAGQESAEPAKPEAQIVPPAARQPAAPAVESAPKAAKKENEELPPPYKPPYRGLLSDLLAGLGEKWIDRGTLYLPIPSGGEVVLNLEDFPVVRFGNGIQALIDFRGVLPANVGTLIGATWKNYRVVSMEGAGDAGEMIDRLLRVSGYHSVKDGRARPLVIGEEVSVALPARWVVLRAPRSLLSGEVILVKEVSEKPMDELAAVLRYADKVGIRVLPYAADPKALEGFLVGIDNGGGDPEDPSRLAVPPGGLAALDFALDYLGIPKKEGERLSIGGKGDGFQLVIQPERMFETGGKRYIADTGKMSSALRTLVRDSGYTVFAIGRDDTGKTIFRRVLREAGVALEERREFLLAGGEKEGYTVRVTGSFVTSPERLRERKVREAVLVSGRPHAATRALLRDLGVEIVGW
ncbi:MAG: LysM peptidoglycan-binding domain-containing protein [Deltaproteobacteria bacterium]|nr:LysM peptidoglycan-binding domain-containing protein [Deltaproteobacteria bacterium]